MNNFELISSDSSQLVTFPVKLKAIVDDEKSDHLIYWSEDGQSFHIKDENKFAKEIVPQFFKHNNIASFIRQLNMYGFHKVNRIDSNSLNYTINPEDSQWKHQYFIRDRPDLINQIVRKSSIVTPKSSNLQSLVLANSNYDFDDDNNIDTLTIQGSKENMTKLIHAVHMMKKKEEKTERRLKDLELENARLNEEIDIFKEEQQKQGNLINLLVQMYSIYKGSSHNRGKRNLLALDMPTQNTTKFIDDDDYREPSRKYFVTSPPHSDNFKASTSFHQPSTSNFLSNNNNKIQVIKPNFQSITLPKSTTIDKTLPSPSQRKVVKITNLRDAQLSNSPKHHFEFNLPNNNKQLSTQKSIVPFTVSTQKTTIPTSKFVQSQFNPNQFIFRPSLYKAIKAPPTTSPTAAATTTTANPRLSLTKASSTTLNTPNVKIVNDFNSNNVNDNTDNTSITTNDENVDNVNNFDDVDLNDLWTYINQPTPEAVDTSTDLASTINSNDSWNNITDNNKINTNNLNIHDSAAISNDEMLNNYAYNTHTNDVLLDLTDSELIGCDNNEIVQSNNPYDPSLDNVTQQSISNFTVPIQSEENQYQTSYNGYTNASNGHNHSSLIPTYDQILQSSSKSYNLDDLLDTPDIHQTAQSPQTIIPSTTKNIKTNNNFKSFNTNSSKRHYNNNFRKSS